MSQEQDNVRILKNAFEIWNDTKGGSTDHWLNITTDDVDFRSLAEGAAGLEFTRRRSSKSDFEGFLQALASQWEMIHYTVDDYVAQGDRVVAVGNMAWRNNATGKEFDTPIVDVVRFKDGQIAAFFELYDTAKIQAASQPSVKVTVEN